jgi:predicted nuclease with RNAse H fold
MYSDEEILRETLRCKPEIVAVDAPLSLPPGRKTIEDRSGEHLRASDRELLRRGIRFFPITLGPMRKLTVRGIGLRRIFEEKGLKVIEVYPGGAQDVLGISRKQRGLEKLRAGLEQLGIVGLGGSESDHELDAVTCAYVGKLFLKEKVFLMVCLKMQLSCLVEKQERKVCRDDYCFLAVGLGPNRFFL